MEKLESTRRIAEAEIAALADQEERVEEPERDRDALIEFYAGTVPEALDRLTTSALQPTCSASCLRERSDISQHYPEMAGASRHDEEVP